MSARSVLVWLSVTGSLAVLGAACGSTSSADDLFGNPGITNGEGGSTTTTTTSASNTVSSGETSTSSSSSSSGGGGAASSSTGPMVTSSSSTTSSGPGDTSVFCAGAPCDQGQVCCFNLENGALDACGAPGACGPGTITLSCNDAEDCPGQVCCGDWNGMGYSGVSCQPQCAGLTMCGNDPQACELNQQCVPSGYLGNGYGYCE